MQKKVYAILNIENPIVAWEVAIGRIKSVPESEYNINNSWLSNWSYSLLRKYATKGNIYSFINELKLEQIRLDNYQNSVSRLRGIYFFENIEDAYAAIDRWGFKSNLKKYISEVLITVNKLTKVDSEWITFYLGNKNNNDQWIHNYWQGKIHGEKPLYELIIEGVGYVLNQEIRKEAYSKIYYKYPTATPLLAMACCAFNVSGIEDIAISRGYLTSSNDKILGQYIMNIGILKEQEQEISKAINISKERNQLPPSILPQDGKSFFTIPDFRDHFFEIENPVAMNIYKDVHR